MKIPRATVIYFPHESCTSTADFGDFFLFRLQYITSCVICQEIKRNTRAPFGYNRLVGVDCQVNKLCRYADAGDPDRVVHSSADDDPSVIAHTVNKTGEKSLTGR